MTHRIQRSLVAVAAITLGGCSFIDDFDFEVADGSVAADAASEDGGQPTDGAVPGDGSVADGGGTPCADPCLSDAVDDFGSTQGSGPLQWRYLNDRRQETGLQYGELALSTYLAAPAWTDASPPPAIVDCRESADDACIDGRLLFAADRPGSGSDPVLAFTAPNDGTYVVVVDVLSVDGGPASVTISRTSRLDTVAVAELSGPGSLTGVVDLLAGDRALLTVAPAADPGGAVAVGADVRVSRVIGAEPLEDCQLVARFPEGSPLELGCSSGALTEGRGTDDSIPTAGPSPAHGEGRSWARTARGLLAPGQRMDYSGDFTIQLWLLADSLAFEPPTIYSDTRRSSRDVASGVFLALARSGAGGEPNVARAGFVFPEPTTGPPVDSAIVCTLDEVCTGTIEAAIPALDEWHFYRIVRRSDLEEVRLCIDGELVGTAPLGRDVDISNQSDPKLARFDEFRDALIGAIDDVRIFARALPCGD